jgi:hypothetical protein
MKRSRKYLKHIIKIQEMDLAFQKDTIKRLSDENISLRANGGDNEYNAAYYEMKEKFEAANKAAAINLEKLREAQKEIIQLKMSKPQEEEDEIVRMFDKVVRKLLEESMDRLSDLIKVSRKMLDFVVGLDLTLMNHSDRLKMQSAQAQLVEQVSLELNRGLDRLSDLVVSKLLGESE